MILLLGINKNTYYIIVEWCKNGMCLGICLSVSCSASKNIICIMIRMYFNRLIIQTYKSSLLLLILKPGTITFEWLCYNIDFDAFYKYVRKHSRTNLSFVS